MRRTGILCIIVAALAVGGLGAAAATASVGVDPASYSNSLDPGGSVTIPKVVHTAGIPPKPDIYFLTDSTGSMSGAIGNVQSNASTILSTIAGATTSPMFGAGDYKDFLSGDLYAFHNGASIDGQAPTLAAIGAWSAHGGGDGPEGQLYALHEIATSGSIGWRSNSTRIVVWFGDAPGHDPICSAASGLASDLTTSSVAAELAAANIEVIAISLGGGGYAAGLNDDQLAHGFEYGYDTTCGAPSSVSGEATTIANATGGLDLFAASADDVSNQILNGLTNLPVTVAGSPTCDSGLSVSLDPASRMVTSGENANFSETISVDSGATQGATLTCQVAFTLNGEDAGPDFTQNISIHVNDVTPPTAACTPTTNPAGKQIPPAGNQPQSGENPDGFYQVTASDNVGLDSLVIVDPASSFVSSPLQSGDKLKLTQAPHGTPGQKPMSGVILWHITTNGDPILRATDTSGNVTEVQCLVPPPPK